MNQMSLADALTKAIELEEHGESFYTSCASAVKNEEGKKMFEFLAGEETTHKERLEQMLADEKANPSTTSMVFVPEPEDVAADIFSISSVEGNLDDASDAIDALKIGMDAEEQSITLYSKLAEQCDPGGCATVFNGIVNEEEKHLAILKKEAEFITETGEYYDFKVVTH